MNKPFRWDISKREQLGKLIRGQRAKSYPEFVEDLQKCCSKIVSACDNSNLVFVGRSPESIFDYLSGLLWETSWAKRCTLLNLSLRFDSLSKLPIEKTSSFNSQLIANNLTPQAIISQLQTTCFVDLVASGATFGNLTEALLHLAQKQQLDILALKRKLRYVGITWRTKASPNTWRWKQNVGWVENFKPSAIKNVSIPGRLWDYLGNNQSKVTFSNPPWRWGAKQLQKPPHNQDNLEALRLAFYLFELGNCRDLQIEFTRQLTTETGMKHSWFRTLVNEIRER